MAKIDVFISHSPFDKRLAEGLRYVLASAGLSSWLDCAEVAAGEQIPISVRKAADNCRFFCAVITPRYAETWYSRMTEELTSGREGGKHHVRVIPCLMEGAPPAYLTEERFIDFRKDPAKAQFQLTSELRGYRNGQERGNWAVLGSAAAFFGTVLIAADESKEREAALAEYHAWLLGLANHRALGRALSTRGMPVPASKDDRIVAVIEAVPMADALSETLRAAEVVRICRALDMPSNGTKAENIRKLLGG
jgi:hypothetical protein